MELEKQYPRLRIRRVKADHWGWAKSHIWSVDVVHGPSDWAYSTNHMKSAEYEDARAEVARVIDRGSLRVPSDGEHVYAMVISP